MQKFAKYILFLSLFGVLLYGAGRLYYYVTDGFTIENISSNFPYKETLETRKLTKDEQSLVDHLLSQKFTYFGKGCQSYVFLSEDKEYILKFMKYQRFRPLKLLEYFSFIPQVNEYILGKNKSQKLDRFLTSWKIAFDDLQSETGLVYVHLNKSSHLNKTLVIYDKMGIEHRLNADEMEFLIQKKAQMLESSIDHLMSNQDITGSKRMLVLLLNLILSEYSRGLVDNDPALMQNTGILNNVPVHIDVGQFSRNDDIRKAENYKQDLFNKTYKFKSWLKEQYPELGTFFDDQLYSIIGDRMHQMVPQLTPKDL